MSPIDIQANHLNKNKSDEASRDIEDWKMQNQELHMNLYLG